jgi:hypothetical protein
VGVSHSLTVSLAPASSQALASPARSLTGGTPVSSSDFRGSCSDSSSTSTVPVHVSTVPSCSTSAGSAGAALLFWAVGLGQWAAPQQRRRRLRCSIGVFCRLQAAQGGSEPDFCRRVDTSLLPRSRSVPQAIWPRARKLAAIGGKRREATLPVPCSLLRAAAACCLLLVAACSLLCSAPLGSPCGLLTTDSSAAQSRATAPEPRPTNHTAPEELPAGTGQSGPRTAPAIPRPNSSSKVPACKSHCSPHPKLGPHPRAGVAPFLCRPPVLLRTDRTAPPRACTSLT